MELVLNIGNSFLSAGLFKTGKLKKKFRLPSRPLDPAALRKALAEAAVEVALIGSDNFNAGKTAERVLKNLKIPFSKVSHVDLSVKLQVEKPEEVGIDRIANTYGALALFPGKDAIVVDMGTAVTFDVVSKERKFLGGAIYPGARISAEALHQWTDKLPLVEVKKPRAPISPSTVGNIQSGVYWGLVGTIEKLTAEMKRSYPKAAVVATGGLALDKSLKGDLKEAIDAFEPDLTLIGLYEILKERNL